MNIESLCLLAPRCALSDYGSMEQCKNPQTCKEYRRMVRELVKTKNTTFINEEYLLDLPISHLPHITQ
ncbi:MAG: hypothetical protein KKB31_05905 [Nanoarchaeota archaeon]|nr:hypothetical protein [Nanoarchaeota archaeon]